MLLTRRGKKNTFFCFSPPVMIATFAVEIILILYTLWRYKLTALTRLIAATLFFLALFQLSEYFVCGGAGMNAMQWSRVGYAAITVLPPLGLHILFVLAKQPTRYLIWAAYATAVGFIAYFLLHEQAFSGHECTGNYVIFQLEAMATNLYALYYYGWLLAAIILGFRWRARIKDQARRRGILGLIVGYAVFLIPTSIAVIINPDALSGVPSIMCGFAAIFAFILVFYLLPVMRAPFRKS
jgi:hypothetical protein